MHREPNPDFAGAAEDLAELRLLHLADTALPIGALAHSFGLETLVATEMLPVSDLPEFLAGYLQEVGALEAVACREAFRTVEHSREELSATRWLDLNETLSALKPAREVRNASASLGRNFLQAVIAVGDFPVLREARDVSISSKSLIHHAAAFGLVSAVLGFDVNRAVLAFLHQSTTSLVSACQRLLPIGQNEATRILWNLKPAIVEALAFSATCTLDTVTCFMPLLDWGAMEHPALRTRLFIS